MAATPTGRDAARARVPEEPDPDSGGYVNAVVAVERVLVARLLIVLFIHTPWGARRRTLPPTVPPLRQPEHPRRKSAVPLSAAQRGPPPRQSVGHDADLSSPLLNTQCPPLPATADAHVQPPSPLPPALLFFPFPFPTPPHSRPEPPNDPPSPSTAQPNAHNLNVPFSVPVTRPFVSEPPWAQLAAEQSAAHLPGAAGSLSIVGALLATRTQKRAGEPAGGQGKGGEGEGIEGRGVRVVSW